MRTRPLYIQCSTPLSGVVVARCGSSLPESAVAMPTFSVVPAACAVPITASITAAANTVRLISVALPLPRIDWILYFLSAYDTGKAAEAPQQESHAGGPRGRRERDPS